MVLGHPHVMSPAFLVGFLQPALPCNSPPPKSLPAVLEHRGEDGMGREQGDGGVPAMVCLHTPSPTDGQRVQPSWTTWSHHSAACGCLSSFCSATPHPARPRHRTQSGSEALAAGIVPPAAPWLPRAPAAAPLDATNYKLGWQLSVLP